MDELAAELLTPAALTALEKAQRALYRVRLYACPGPERRVLVVLGETHLKSRSDWVLGKEVLAQFSLRGVEGVQRRQVFAGSVLSVLIELPRRALQALSLGVIRGSTISDAKRLRSGTTAELERAESTPIGLHFASAYLVVFLLAVYAAPLVLLASLVQPATDDVLLMGSMRWLNSLMHGLELHLFALVPAYLLRRRSWAFLIHPLIALVATRDELMACGTVRMLAEHPDAPAALVVMGLGHLRGYGSELTARGFRRVEF